MLQSKATKRQKIISFFEIFFFCAQKLRTYPVILPSKTKAKGFKAPERTNETTRVADAKGEILRYQITFYIIENEADSYLHSAVVAEV